jgi:hypothetical protein
MALRFAPFTIYQDFIEKLTPEIVQKISKDDWINELCQDSLEISETEANKFVSNYLNNLVLGKMTKVEPDQNYIFGYILEAICNEFGEVFEEVGAGYKYYEEDCQSVIGEQLFEIGDMTKNNKSDNFCLPHYQDWEFPVVLYISYEEAKKLLQNLKEKGQISIDVIDDILLCFESSHTRNILETSFNKEEITETAKSSLGYYDKNSSHLGYDSAYIYWLMDAIFKQQDLIVFVH